MKPIRWGILATGEIAKNMVQALNQSSEAEVVAVASRTQARAEDFGRRWNIPVRYGSYQALVEDPNVDVVYIATPHNLHYENMKMCLHAGKHVLCEKAFTLNSKQAKECVRLARQKNLFLMEAMWMRYFPAMQQVREWLENGVIGKVRLVQADFCFNLPFNATHRLYNPKLGGGALLDLGIYPLSFATMVLGFPQGITSYAHIGETGVDELDTIILTYENGATAVLNCSMRIYKPRESFIIGTYGYIKIHNIFFRPDRLTLHLNGHEEKLVEFPISGNGYIYEVEEVHRCLREGKTESAIMPLDETIRLMEVMDEMRSDWQLVYPDEEKIEME